jgi:hypothetical protein
MIKVSESHPDLDLLRLKSGDGCQHRLAAESKSSRLIGFVIVASLAARRIRFNCRGLDGQAGRDAFRSIITPVVLRLCGVGVCRR